MAKAVSIPLRPAVVQPTSSGAPQLMERTLGWFVVSKRAALMASMEPCSEFGAKYTAMFAPGAMKQATSMSISTSPSAEPPGLFTAPSS